MRNTPRSVRASRSGIGTLIGNGWLRESPRHPWPQGNARGKSALRKCMFMPVPEELRGLIPQVSPAALHPAAPLHKRVEPEIVPHRRDPRKDAREFPAYVPGAIDPRAVAQQAHAMNVQNLHNAQKAAALQAAKPAASWWDDPVALGTLLIVVPPIGLAAVWSSKRYSSDARWALTIMTALTMCLMSAIVIAALAMR